MSLHALHMNYSLLSNLPKTSSRDEASKGDISEVIKSDEGEHIYIVGTIENMYELDSTSFADAVRLAKPVKYGKNNCFNNYWFVLNDKLRTPSLLGVTQAIHVRKEASIHDEEKFNIAVCAAPNNDVLMIETPALEREEIDDLMADMAEINVMTE